MTVMTYWEYKQTQEALSLGAKDDTFTLPDYQKGYLRAVLDSYICNQYQNVDEDDLPRRAFYSDTTNEHILVHVDEDEATDYIEEARSHGVAWNRFDIQYGWDHEGKFWAVAHPASAFGKNPSEHYVLLAGDRYEV